MNSVGTDGCQNPCVGGAASLQDEAFASGTCEVYSFWNDQGDTGADERRCGRVPLSWMEPESGQQYP